MTIKYEVRTNYGTEHFYALDQNHRKAIEKISGNVTITPQVAEGLKALGIQFENVTSTATL